MMTLDDKQVLDLGKIPSHKVYENDQLFAFLDINPVSTGHTQVIPKYHARVLTDLPDEYLTAIGPALKTIALATGAKDFNVIQNNGKLAFQHVDHVHFHIVPKTSEDDGLVFKNVEQMWPVKNAEPESLAATAEEMKARLKA